jgi:hypothetical protein
MVDHNRVSFIVSTDWADGQGLNRARECFLTKILEDDGVIVLASIGQVTVEEFQTFAPKFFAEVRSRGQIRRLLLDNREHQGWGSREAQSITFFSWMESRSLFDRIAVVFHAGIRNEVEKLVELYRNAGKDARSFQPEQYKAALDWLKGDEAADAKE